MVLINGWRHYLQELQWLKTYVPFCSQIVIRIAAFADHVWLSLILKCSMMLKHGEYWLIMVKNKSEEWTITAITVVVIIY